METGGALSLQQTGGLHLILTRSAGLPHRPQRNSHLLQACPCLVCSLSKVLKAGQLWRCSCCVSCADLITLEGHGIEADWWMTASLG